MQGDAGDEDHYFFFSAPASPVHYILRSPPSSTAADGASSPHRAAPADGDCCADFEFAARGAGPGGGTEAAVTMSSAEELFVAGRIRVGSPATPIRRRQGEAATEGPRHEDCWNGGGDEERDGRSPRARRARSASPPRSPRAAEPSDSDPFASASSSSSSSSSAKSIRRRISLRDLLARTGGDCAGAADQESGAEIGRVGFWPPSIWPSRSSKKALLSSCPSPCPAPRPGRRSTSSERPAKRAPGGSARRTTSLPYRQGLILGCLGFGARSYGLASSMHPLSSR